MQTNTKTTMFQMFILRFLSYYKYNIRYQLAFGYFIQSNMNHDDTTRHYFNEG